MLSDRIATLKLPSPVCVDTDSSVRELIETVQRNRDDAVVVCDDKGPVGLMTERDVLMKVVARDVNYDDPVERFLTPIASKLTLNSTIGEAIALMTREGVHKIPVMDEDGGPAAVLRVRDIIDHLAESYPEHVVNLPPRPHQRLETQEGA